MKQYGITSKEFKQLKTDDEKRETLLISKKEWLADPDTIGVLGSSKIQIQKGFPCSIITIQKLFESISAFTGNKEDIKKTNEQFIKEANIVHNNKYTYPNFIYKGNRIAGAIECPNHGEFRQQSGHHLKGHGCPKCGIESRIKIQSGTTEEFIKKANIIHNFRYDYSKVIYKNIDTKVIIICPEHGDFTQTSHSHLNGHGCSKCVGLYQPTTEEFVEKANIVHNNKYTYPNFIYKGSKVKGKIECPNHGEFRQKPNQHLGGQGCPKCGRNNVSKAEIVFLDEMEITKEYRQYKIKLTKYRSARVDGYNPKTNTVYEFNGDLWHGNPDVFLPDDIHPITSESMGDIYERTIKREQELLELGYTLVVCWENGRLERKTPDGKVKRLV